MKYKNKLSGMIQGMYEGLVNSGVKPDSVVCGPGFAAVDVTDALEELSLDLHIVSDDEVSRYFISVFDSSKPLLNDLFKGTVN